MNHQRIILNYLLKNFIQNITHPTEESVYGFIAQQVNEIIPDAIYNSSEFIPDILQNAKLILVDDKVHLQFNEEYELEVNNVLLVNGKECNIVEKIDEKTYLTNLNKNEFNDKEKEKDCFVYGKKVNEFMNLKKDYIYALHFSAT